MLKRKRLLTRRQLKDLQSTQNYCLICMNILSEDSEKGILPCSHQSFCFQCIIDWARFANSCPLCKQRFYAVNSSISNKKVNVTDCDQMVENGEITIEISCNVCGSDLDDDIMLLCDNCDNGFHTTCIGMNGIPNISQWFCKDCEWTLGDFQRKKQWIEMEKVGSKAEEEVKEHLEKPRKRLRKLNCAYIRRGK